MTDFFPFIHQPKKKNKDLEPLYVELYPPLPEKREEKIEEEENRGVIIIQL
jgi:hypothetical protein